MPDFRPEMANENHLDPAALDAEALQAHPSFASTLANGLAVLGCFSTGEPSLSNRDIAVRLGLTKPTVSRLAFTLIGLGYLRRDRLTGQYQLGPAVLSLGYPLLAQLTIRQIASDDMLALARYARGPISVGARDRLQAVYVETSQGKESNATKPGIGSTRPLLRTAMGRALLYAHPNDERRVLENRLAQTVAEDWQVHGPRLPAAYDEIATKGFCTVAGDWRPTLAAVAAPLKHPVAGLWLAVNLTVPTFAATPQQLEEDLGPRLVELVRRMEQRMGH